MKYFAWWVSVLCCIRLSAARPIGPQPHGHEGYDDDANLDGEWWFRARAFDINHIPPDELLVGDNVDCFLVETCDCDDDMSPSTEEVQCHCSSVKVCGGDPKPKALDPE
jgi:hypothetical protein